MPASPNRRAEHVRTNSIDAYFPYINLVKGTIDNGSLNSQDENLEFFSCGPVHDRNDRLVRARAAIDAEIGNENWNSGSHARRWLEEVYGPSQSPPLNAPQAEAQRALMCFEALFLYFPRTISDARSAGN